MTDPFLNPANQQTMRDFYAKYPYYTSATMPNMETFTIADIEKANGLYVPPINTPTLNPGAIPTLSPVKPPTFDPLLSPASILAQNQKAQDLAATPVDPNKFIVPGSMELMAKNINDQANVNKASAQSTFAARGLTGSSTELQTLTRDIPAAANTALAEGTVKLLQAAYPLAMQEKQMAIDTAFKGASLSTQLRQLMGNEAFQTLSLDQQREIANQDVQLKLNLADVEMKFQAQMKQAEFAFTHAENEANRELARQELAYAQSERKKARQQAFMKSLTSLVGFGIGVGMAPEGAAFKDVITSGAVGASVGGGSSDLFGFLMD